MEESDDATWISNGKMSDLFTKENFSCIHLLPFTSNNNFLPYVHNRGVFLAMRIKNYVTSLLQWAFFPIVYDKLSKFMKIE